MKAGNAGVDAQSSKGTRPLRGSALRDLLALLKTTSAPSWATPVMVILGLASSFAESLGISLVVLFLYSAMGHLGEVKAANGLLATLFHETVGRFGSGTTLAVTIFVLIMVRGVL